MKKVIYVLVGIIALAMTQSCKTYSRVKEKRQETNSKISDEYNDTTKTHRVTVTTVEKTPTGGTKITEEVAEQQVKKRKKETSAQRRFRQKDEENDRLTPTLYNIERKGKKDSLNHALKMEKQKTKQVKSKTTTPQIVLIIILSLIIFVTWPIVKSRMIKNY